MKKVNISRKILMGVGTAVMTAITLGTSTYAWFARNGDAVVEKTEFNLESAEGLRISLDGEHFSQDITLSQLKEVIKKNTGKEYEDLKYQGVTLKYDDTGKVVYNADTKFPEFEKFELERRSSKKNNGTAYKSSDVKYNHKFVDADKSDYLSFDLYFQVDYVGKTVAEDYDLWFSSERSDTGEPTGIYGKETEVLLHNDLETMTKKYAPNDKVLYSPVNAMRLGVYNHNDSKLIVYEQGVGLGSKAVDSTTYNGVTITFFDDDVTYYTKVSDNVYESIARISEFADGVKYYTYDGTTYTSVESTDVFNVNTPYYVSTGSNDYVLVHMPFDDNETYYVKNQTAVEDRFNPFKNAMYTYYNNNHPYERFDDSDNTYIAARFKEDTIIPTDTQSAYTQSRLAGFSKKTDGNGYEVIKMSFNFWLEGWDADFLEMTEEKATDFSISLAFELRSR